MRVLFSVLSYYPSFITSESINIGILFHNIDTDTRIFETTSNWTRIKNFDDELDIDYIKFIMKGINEEIGNSNLFNYKEEFNLRKYIKFYVNELKFSDVAFINTDDFEYFISETKKMFLRYDFDKKDRPNHQQQLAYIKTLLKDNNVEYSIKQIEGSYKENIYFDYIVDGYAFKLFTFENKNLNKLIFYAKSWAYTAIELKDKYKIIFVYDLDINDEYFKSIMNIFEGSAFKVMKMNEAIDFILKLKESKNFTVNFIGNSSAAKPSNTPII